MKVRLDFAAPPLRSAFWSLLCAGLAACGGGADDAHPPTAATPITPPVAATPPVTPPTVYSTSYAAASASASTVSDGRTLRVTGITTPLKIAPLDRISYQIEDRGSSGWLVDTNGFQETIFGPSHVTSPTSALFESFRRRDGVYIENFDLANAMVGMGLTHTRLALYSSGESSDPAAPLPAVFVFLAAGKILNNPAAGTYSGIADGLWFDGTTTRRLYGSQATITVDSLGTSTVTLNLRGYDDAFGRFEAAPTTALAAFSGTGPRSQFSSAASGGTFSDAAGYSGSYSGHFYGPGASASEVGIAFTLRGPGAAGAFGVVVARR